MADIANCTITKEFFGINAQNQMIIKFELSGDGWGCIYSSPPLDEDASLGFSVIRELLEVFQVYGINDFYHKYIRCKIEDQRVVSIGDIIKDRWFSFEEIFKRNQMKCDDIDIESPGNNEEQSVDDK